ncbi:MAG TPA: glycosyltransferase family 87 protein, partial [Candidatus Binataceae bacterium]|nr:glycosyltransferase family 87 protein [Candidatus Binataceae bacterium]
AWAVRSGQDIYAVPDPHGWHFNYLPIYAIALVPLADPPPNVARAGMFPFGVSVAIWYIINLVCLARAVNILAAVLERAMAPRLGGIPPPYSRSWWSLRVIPVVIAVAPVGFTLGRGQSNLILLLAISAMIAAVLERRMTAAGLWLAAAICIKVIPVYLLIYPLWRRNLRMLAGCGVGLFIGLFMIPAVVLGPARALGYLAEWNRVVAHPASAPGGDRSRDAELLDPNRNDIQSIQAIVHRWSNFSETVSIPRGAFRSSRLQPYARVVHWAGGAILTVITLMLAGLYPRDALSEELVIASLLVPMILLSLASHLHYYALLIPLIMGLMAWACGPQVYPGERWIVFFASLAIALLLPLIPGLEMLGDLGLAAAASLSLWAAALVVVSSAPRNDDKSASGAALSLHN